MSRDFASASNHRIDVGSNSSGPGNWEYTQAWSVVGRVRPKTNAAGGVVTKQEGSGNFRGWQTSVRGGTSTPQFAAEVCNTSASARASIRTTNEFPLNAFRTVIWTYSGSGTAAGFSITVDGVSQALTTIQDNLGGATILNSVACQMGSRGGTAAPTFFANALFRRVLLYNVVLTADEIATMSSVDGMVTRGLVFWHEFGPLAGDGSTLSPDWSGNGNTGFINGATYSTTDPTITALNPATGLTGGASLSGPLTRNVSNPIMTNQGYTSGGTLPAGTSGDQIGPGVIIKRGAGDYIAFQENVTGAKSLDVGNQPGVFDFDTGSIAGTSADGTTWTWTAQGDPASALFTCNNLGGDATFKAAVQGETSISSVIRDPVSGDWLAYFHGGNNSGTRRIYLAKCLSANDPLVAGNWAVQNGGAAILDVGAGGAWDAGDIADARVVRRSATSWLMLYNGYDAGGNCRIGLATASDGSSWSKSGSNPVITVGAAGTWDAGGVHVGGFAWDAALQCYTCWYGGGTGGGTTTSGIGYDYSSDAATWTKGAFNPVHCKKGAAGLEDRIANTVAIYLDGTTYRMQYQCDDGVSGAAGFRGRGEASIAQVFMLGSGTNQQTIGLSIGIGL